MIQRIQTIWVFSIIILIVVVMFVGKIVHKFDQFVLIVTLSGLIIIASVIAIFLFKKRLLQIKVCYLIFVLLFIFLVTLLLSRLYLRSLFLVVAILMNIFAIQAIKRDEKLIKSLDRLR